MPVSGKVYIVPLPDEKKWQLIVENTGSEVFGITQNILPPNDPNRTQHDDHGRYGHGLPVNPGQVSYQKFVMGDMYLNQYAITEDCFLRVGIRGHANKTVKLPKMTDAPIELDIADFNWYAGSPAQHRNQVNEWKGTREYVPNAQDGKATLTRVKELIERASTKGIKCEGQARIVCKKGDNGALSHWEVWFENTGKQPWVGTCSFVRGEKNAGIGLEAMATPTENSSAMQRIEAFGNYGVEALPGEKLRLGVRGYSWIEAELPRDGEKVIPLSTFRLDTSKMTPEFFDAAAVLTKRNEKVARVQFFEAGKPVNGSLEPKLWRGDEAKARADFDPPRLTVTVVEDTPATPGGGWWVTVESRMPEFDDFGRVGCVVALKLVKADPASPGARTLPPKKLAMPGEPKHWFVPLGVDLGGTTATEGTELVIATRGLGWFATVALPAKGKVVDSDNDKNVWGLREDQYNRQLLRPEFVQRLRE